ncbi:FAD-dependent thymidylate synthase [Bacteroidota bacterium]
MAEKKININKKYDCLDKGFIRLVDYMGDDSAIVQAARVSYGKGTKSVTMDRELIRYLMRHRHTSPFEMVEFKFHVKLPIFVARQWIRHRTANVNEYSGRYSEMKNEFYLPELEQLRHQSSMNRQARGDRELPKKDAENILKKLDKTQEKLFNDYESYLAKDLARELSRINLPLSTYTEWYWKIDLHNLMHFLKLRLDWHAQYEIRVYAEKITELIKPIVPLTYQSFEDYLVNSISFSDQESSIINMMINKDLPDEKTLAKKGIKGLELKEFRKKIELLKNK